MAPTQTEGWYWPPNARKAHFYDDQNRSLCGRYFVFHIGQYDGDASAPESSDDCRGCRAKVDKRNAKAAGE